MSVYNSSELLLASPDKIPAIAAHIESVFKKKNFVVDVKNLEGGGCELTLHPPVESYRTTVVAQLLPYGDSYVKADCKKSEYFTDVAKLILTIFCPVCWPFFLFSCITQARLDNKVINVAKDALIALNMQPYTPTAPQSEVQIPAGQKQFCTDCGTEYILPANNCPGCGKPLGQPQPLPQPKPQTIPHQPQPQSQPLGHQQKPMTKSPIMMIVDLCWSSDILMVRGTCESLVTTGDWVKVETLDQSVVIAQVSSIQVNFKPASQSEVGKEIVLYLDGVRLDEIRGGDKIYHK